MTMKFNTSAHFRANNCLFFCFCFKIISLFQIIFVVVGFFGFSVFILLLLVVVLFGLYLNSINFIYLQFPFGQLVIVQNYRANKEKSYI